MKKQKPMEAAAASLPDDQLELVASKLMKLAVRDAIETYAHGTPDMKAALTKTFITAMSKQLAENKQGDSNETLRNEFQSLIGLVE